MKRLSEKTRKLAAAYLQGEMRSRLREAPAYLDDPELPEMLRRANCAVKMAECVDLCIVPQERLAGAAPFMDALNHMVPGMGIASISHTTVEFGDAIRLGLSGLEKEIKLRGSYANSTEETMFVQALLKVISAIRIWIKRYISAYSAMLKSGQYQAKEKNIRQIISNLNNCPENPPNSFAEALQSFWIFFEFERLCGNWS